MPEEGIIKSIKAREILDSRGNPTIEVDALTSSGLVRASVPAGASTGRHEAWELRDNNGRYNGKGVQKAVKLINTVVAKKFKDVPIAQNILDQQLLAIDGTYEKKRLGANSMLAVSIAACKAGALVKNIPLYAYLQQITNRTSSLPIPAFNIINGGAHAGNNLSFQEYMLIPNKAKSFAEALQIGSEVYHKLKQLLEKKYGKQATNVGDEGGFAPMMSKHTEPLEFLHKAVDECGYKNQVVFGIDAAASQFYTEKGKESGYLIDGKKKTADQLHTIYTDLVKRFNVRSIEDPFHEEAFEDFANLTKTLKNKAQIVGDDLLCTNPGRIHQAITSNACNALLLKPNQIGTVTEALDAASLALSERWNLMVSHRSGDTTDDFIADLAVGLGAGQIKSGAPARGERVAKYNQLLRIEEQAEGKIRLANPFK